MCSRWNHLTGNLFTSPRPPRPPDFSSLFPPPWHPTLSPLFAETPVLNVYNVLGPLILTQHNACCPLFPRSGCTLLCVICIPSSGGTCPEACPSERVQDLPLGMFSGWMLWIYALLSLNFNLIRIQKSLRKSPSFNPTLLIWTSAVLWWDIVPPYILLL